MVAALGVDGELDGGLDDVPGLTAAPGQVVDRVELGLAVGVQDGIGRAVERIAGVVRHAPVDDDVVLVARDALDAGDGVDRHAGVGDDAAARLHQEEGQRETVCGAAQLQVLRNAADAGGDVDVLVGVEVAHAVAAAHVQHLRHIAEALVQFRHEGGHHVDRVLEDRLVEDFGTHMAVQSAHRERGQAERVLDKGIGLAGLHRDAELHVDGAGIDGLIGVRVDARRDAQQHLLHDVHARGLFGQLPQLVGIVHDEVPDTLFQGVADVSVGLSVAVEEDFFRGEARRERGMDLARRDGVDAHALLVHDPVHCPESSGLPGIERERALTKAVAEGLGIHAAVMAEPLLIHQVERRAILLRQRRNRVPGKLKPPVLGTLNVVRKHVVLPAQKPISSL